ncbi:hypothetical protein YC2023_107805 [Brassica napus]
MYKITENQFVIGFIPSTRIVEVQTDAPVIKFETFMVRCYDHLQVLANTNLELPGVFYCSSQFSSFGLANIVGEIRSVQGSDLKNNAATSKVVLKPYSNCFYDRDVTVYLSLRDEAASNFRGFLKAGDKPQSVMLVITVNPKLFGGNMYLNSTQGTRFFFNTNIPEITKFVSSVGATTAQAYTCVDTLQGIKKKELVSIEDLNSFISNSNEQENCGIHSAFGKAKNLYGQASGTRKCFEMIRDSGTEIPQEMIDVFKEQEKFHEAEATKLHVGPLSDSNLTLSPLVLPSRFVEDRFRASFDPYGSNVNLIRPETTSQLITSREVVEDPSEEPLVDVTSAPTEHVEVLEKDAPEECPEKENLDQIPEKDVPETDDTLVQEKGTENAGTEDPVLVSDSSSGGQDGEEEEGDRAEETSPPPPNEVETVEEVEEENFPTQVEDPVAPVDPPASRSEGDQDSAT